MNKFALLVVGSMILAGCSSRSEVTDDSDEVIMAEEVIEEIDESLSNDSAYQFRPRTPEEEREYKWELSRRLRGSLTK